LFRAASDGTQRTYQTPRPPPSLLPSLPPSLPVFLFLATSCCLSQQPHPIFSTLALWVELGGMMVLKIEMGCLVAIFSVRILPQVMYLTLRDGTNLLVVSFCRIRPLHLTATAARPPRTNTLRCCDFLRFVEALCSQRVGWLAGG